MLNILNTVLPVFFIVGAGYLAVKYKLFADAGVTTLMMFTQNFAVPALLFLALYRLDFGAYFDLRLIFSFYTGAILCFALGYLGARRIFNRRPGNPLPSVSGRSSPTRFCLACRSWSGLSGRRLWPRIMR